MTPSNPSAIAGLAGPGLLWLATSVAVGQVAPPLPGPPTPSAPTSTSSTFTVLLMSNGSVVRGEIAYDPSGGVYRIQQRGGQFPYPRSMVKKAGNSLDELYRFQLAGLPPRDPDERMKLAKWCLAQGLTAQGREQVDAVLAMCPGDAEAKRMAEKLTANADRVAPVDSELRRTSGESPGDTPPAPLDGRIAKLARQSYGRNALPEIFDLPPALAVARASDFARYVQPVLLKGCAGCHDERYQGGFQLVSPRTVRDLQNPDVARANLDATLKLVNPDDPTRSDLLSAGLVPHGKKAAAIFKGPNDPDYRVIATWVRSLRPAAPAAGPRASNGVTRAGFDPGPTSSSAGFGSDRPGRGGPKAMLPPLPADPDAGPQVIGPPSRTTVQRYETTAAALGIPPDASFPLPFTAGGEPPAARKPAPKRPVPPPIAPAPNEPNQGPASPTLPATTARPATPIAPGAVAVGPSDDRNLLPGMDMPLYPTSPKADPAEPSKAVPDKKKPKLDPALLEKLMKSRNANP